MSGDPVLTIPQHILGPMFVQQGRGIFKRSKYGDYVWQYNCGRICEAEAEVKALNRNRRTLIRSADKVKNNS
jgi:hypothetical protein